MRIRIQGRQPLRGTYQVAGSTNEAVTLIAAAMLADSPVTLQHMPDTASVGVMLEIATALGLQVTDAVDGQTGTIRLNAANLFGRVLAREHTEALTSSLLLLAPILARRRHARMNFEFPVSRIHPHLTALRDLGLTVNLEGQGVDLEAHDWDHAEIILTQTSVTATALVAMLAAVFGKRTTIINAASEPQIRGLFQALTQMGARIEGIGSNLVQVYGQQPLRGGTWVVGPDHIEAASIAACAALTGGRLTIEGTHRQDLRMIAKVYERLGVHISLDDDAIIVPVHERFEISARDEDVDVSVESAPYPGFPSDLIAMATVIATQARGTALIHEKLFSNRLLFVDRLTAMGAQIILCDPHRAIVLGATPLQGDYIDTPDVRTGLAMLAAALCAEGETVIDSAEVFDRYFEHVLDKLVLLGARIKRSEP